MSNVYSPSGGVVNVSVAGGEAVLLPGHDEGWIASSVIACPPGHRYDYAVVEADLPGGSHVELSILNASKAPSEPGFANATIDGFVRKNGTVLSLDPLDHLLYPSIRMQADLFAAGSDRPRLLGWSVRFIGLDEWRDEFLTTGRMTEARGINLTDGTVELNLTRKGLGLEGYGPFPTVVYSRDNLGMNPNTLDVFYPNASRTNYTGIESVACKDTRGLTFDDLDGDGRLDLVCANHYYNDAYVDSEIWWGKRSGKLSATGATSLKTVRALDVETGDFNGDGWVDIAFACWDHRESPNSTVFLNKGEGKFNFQPDVKFVKYSHLDTGDVNNDGYDDIVCTSKINIARCYFGGPNGPDALYDLSFHTSGYQITDVTVEDIDGDGYTDVLFSIGDSRQFVFMGGPNGVDDEVDFLLATSGSCWASAAGDFNGDGYTDLFFIEAGHDEKLYIFEGSAMGWSSSDMHLVGVNFQPCTIDVHDLNWDGYDDVLVGTQAEFLVYYGGTSWPINPYTTPPAISYRDIYSPYNSAIAVPKDGPSEYIGTFTTEAIALPEDGKWEELSLVGTLPQNTNMSLSVLDDDMDEIPGYGGITNWTVDLREAPIGHTMHIKVTITSEVETATPVLEYLTVGWRVCIAPEVLGMKASSSKVFRTQQVNLTFGVTDEHDPPHDLYVEIECRPGGSSSWSDYLISSLNASGENWSAVFSPYRFATTGFYDFRIMVRDSDGKSSGYVVFPSLVEVLNNHPNAPVVSIMPETAFTTSTLVTTTVAESTDVEGTDLMYNIKWFLDGEPIEDLTGDSVPPSLTWKGQNWSVEVRAFDGEDEGPPGTAWKLISNSQPVATGVPADPVLDEDTVDEDQLDLVQAFEDPDGDSLEWSLDRPPVHLEVDLDQVTGRVTLQPEKDWYGEENVTFSASDGELRATWTVKVRVRPVNDAPRFVSVDGEAITQDLFKYTILQNELLVIEVETFDVEGDELLLVANTTAVDVDPTTGEVRFLPDNTAVGTLEFHLTLFEAGALDPADALFFSVVVENRNDEMEDPVILEPADGATFKVGDNITLDALCEDPDLMHGQVLNFSWSSNISGLLGWGPNLAVELKDPGTHLITLTVSDPDFNRTATVTILVEDSGGNGPPPAPPGDGGDKGLPLGLMLGILVVIVAVVIGLAILKRSRPKGPDVEVATDTDEQ